VAELAERPRVVDDPSPFEVIETVFPLTEAVTGEKLLLSEPARAVAILCVVLPISY